MFVPRNEQVHISIHCPSCHTQDTDAFAWELTETVELVPTLGLGPSKRTTYVTCGSCETQLISKVQLSALVRMDANASEPKLRMPLGSGTTSFAVATFLLSLIPLFGLVLSIVAVAKSIRRNSWQKWLSLIALLVTLCFHSFVVYAIAFANNQ